METVYILQIITIGITLISLVANICVTIFENRKTNYVEIITSSRLEFMKNNRTEAASFIVLCRKFALGMRSDHSYDIDKIDDLYMSFEKIKLFLKPCYSIDSRIIKSGEKIVSSIEDAVLKKEIDINVFLSEINVFEKLFSVYDAADWKFVKEQFNGKNGKSMHFDEICDEFERKFNNEEY